MRNKQSEQRYRTANFDSPDIYGIRVETSKPYLLNYIETYLIFNRFKISDARLKRNRDFRFFLEMRMPVVAKKEQPLAVVLSLTPKMRFPPFDS